jgi:3-keto-disaccharide hydrolase
METLVTRRAVIVGSALAATAATSKQLASGMPEPRVHDGKPHGDPPFLLEKGWSPLLNNRDLSGWTYEHPEKGGWRTSAGIYWDGERTPKELTALPGPGTRIANGPEGGNSNIYTRQKFGDVELYVEFLIPAKSNSGVYLHGLYEVQVYDSYGVEHPKYIDCGAIYERWIREKGVGGWPPLVNASRPAGEWQSFHIWFKGPRLNDGRKTVNATFVRVLHNGILVHENTEIDGPTRSGLDIPEASENPLMLQGDHGPVAYRNIYFRSLRPFASYS